jgi:hypothetical protein
MSIIQKMENSYLGILRVVIILAATILLILAAVMGVFSLKGMFPSSEQKLETVSVDSKDLLEKIAPEEKSPEQPQSKVDGEKSPASISQPEYEKIFLMSDTFVKKYSKDTESIDKDLFFKFLETKSITYPDLDVKASYINGMVVALESSLKDKRVIARVEKPVTPAAKPVPVPAPAPVPAPELQDGEQSDGSIEAAAAIPAPPVIPEKPFKESPIGVLGEIIDAYSTIFDSKLNEAKDKQSQKLQEQMADKAASTMQMYVAAGLFGVFLLVVFLSIVIRIERNLREIASKP